jgi:two-component system, LytTR family, response regulator
MELPKDLFFRIHKSYIINLKHIIKISSGQTMMVNLSEGHTAEVSRRKRNELSDLLL